MYETSFGAMNYAVHMAMMRAAIKKAHQKHKIFNNILHSLTMKSQFLRLKLCSQKRVENGGDNGNVCGENQSFKPESTGASKHIQQLMRQALS